MVEQELILGEAKLGRRRESRLRVRLPARLVTVDRTSCAVIADLSVHGAQLTGASLRLRPGQECILQWEGYEAFGTVAWQSGDACGLTFEGAVSGQVLAATRRLHDSRVLSVSDDRRGAAVRRLPPVRMPI